MKPQLQLIKSALGGPQATTAEAQMIKLQDGRMWAYGGPFCLSTPIESSLECGFFPGVVENFYSIDRPEGVTLTEKDGYLLITCNGKEWKTKRVDSHTIPSLIALGPRQEIIKPLAHLPAVANLCRNNTQCFRQAAWFVDGRIFAMKGCSLCIAVDGLPLPHPVMGIPADSMQALARLKSPLTHFVYDRLSLQFECEDGTWLATRLVEGINPPDFSPMFAYEAEQFVELKFNPDVVKEIMALKLYGRSLDNPPDMTWEGKDGVMSFHINHDGTEPTGRFPDAYEGEGEFVVKGETLRAVLGMEPEVVGLMRRDEGALPHSINGYGDGFAVAGQLSRV